MLIEIARVLHLCLGQHQPVAVRAVKYTPRNGLEYVVIVQVGQQFQSKPLYIYINTGHLKQ